MVEALPANILVLKAFFFNALKSSESNNLYHQMEILASRTLEN